MRRHGQGAPGVVWISLVSTVFVFACAAEGEQAPAETTLSELDSLGNGDVLVLGDWGSGTDSQRAVAAAMRAHAAETSVAAIVTTGDNFYSDDADTLMEPFAWALEDGIPLIVSWGNHDIETHSRIRLVEESFDDPPRWALHEWGAIDLVILDSTQLDSPEQASFLRMTLSQNEDPMVIFFHDPPYSCGSHGDTTAVQDEWVPVFDEDVVLVLNGHEHNYQRFQESGITYVVTGGGGAALTPLASCGSEHPTRLAGEAVHHFVSLQTGDELTVTAIDVDGDVIDRFSLPLR